LAHNDGTSALNTSQRILYVCDWLPPDFGAVGQYGVIWARKLASEGHAVTLAGLSSTNDSERTEAVGPGRYREIKFKTAVYDKTNTLRRLFWTIKTNNRLLWRLWREMRTADTILFTGSPPLLIHWIAPANLLLRKRLVYRITDFHPECAIAQRGSAGLFLSLLYRLTVFWRRRVDQFEVLGEDQIARLREIGIPAERIELKRDSSPVAFTQGTLPLSRPMEARSSLLLLYSGNWGIAHDHRTFIDGYRLHHQQGTARFTLWLNATGSAVSAIEEALRAHSLPYVKGAPVPIEQLASLLVTPDAHLIALSDPFVGFVLPSKVYGCIESGKAVLFIGSERSDVHLLCAKDLGPAYQRVEVGDAEGCQRALDRLSALIDDRQSGRKAPSLR
jgi:hypothetical protein